MPKIPKTETETIDVIHGVRLRMPSGDMYAIAWDDIGRRTIVMLDTVGDREMRIGALAITPRASNAVELKPRRRDE